MKEILHQYLFFPIKESLECFLLKRGHSMLRQKLDSRYQHNVIGAKRNFLDGSYKSCFLCRTLYVSWTLLSSLLLPKIWIAWLRQYYMDPGNSSKIPSSNSDLLWPTAEYAQCILMYINLESKQHNIIKPIKLYII